MEDGPAPLLWRRKAKANASVKEEAARGQEEEDESTATMVSNCRMGRLTVYLSRSTSPCSSSVSISSPVSTSVSASPAVVTLPRSSTFPHIVVATTSSLYWFPAPDTRSRRSPGCAEGLQKY